MSEPQSSDNVLVWALGGLATFCGGVVFWILRRNANVEDRDYEARKDFTDKLAELPVRLTVLVDRVDAQGRELDAIRSELAALRDEVRR